ncbi:MAG: hypothetical protein IKM76_03335 [Prevotella sp.]|nr:hypothetical protein [Bacteroidaceae bacterium]MBR6827175.1 hypothetical protein [Prevotella sp.]
MYSFFTMLPLGSILVPLLISILHDDSSTVHSNAKNTLFFITLLLLFFCLT